VPQAEKPTDGLTKAQEDALEWFARHGGDGMFTRGHVLLAQGEIGPHMRATWNKLAEKGFVQFYQNKKRLRLTEKGKQATEKMG
jgi:DNA-binding MarR family transcriptional regulator